MWFLSLFLMHAPHCHYCPLLGGDRDGAEGVDGCWCRAGCHYSIYWAPCARHFPQNGRGAPTWLQLWGINDSHLTLGHKILNTFICCFHARSIPRRNEEICTWTLQIPTLCMGDLTQHTVTLSAATLLYPKLSLAYRMLIKHRSNNGITFI